MYLRTVRRTMHNQSVFLQRKPKLPKILDIQKKIHKSIEVSYSNHSSQREAKRIWGFF